jgi:hypothetical protein
VIFFIIGRKKTHWHCPEASSFQKDKVWALGLVNGFQIEKRVWIKA